MASRDNAYSRFITLAKIGLPLAALALLSTLFLFSRNIDPTQSIPYATVDVEELVREPRVTAPNYSGVTSDGTAIAVQAKAARPDPAGPGRASAEALSARLDFADGSSADITSAQGRVDTAEGLAYLEGGVVIDTSTGYHITTEALTTALEHTSVVTESTVEATGPLGRLTAGRMQIDEDADAPGQYLLVFKDGVKLVYDPGN
ncbi:LPS export ABC transporter periplasmic protein LptC [Actibacterium sp. MT2.3-13A]|uniref:LPS export ABC transporter periplasmic protein LptC n=1 Tax=Actibacterium sp. MT2.3-13A TaxID=2828332 RepID=UPI001BA85070|nr:LPS export ABC transporter periplasmic protein LptC [Actibacterium sp. MT2.3-13A]